MVAVALVKTLREPNFSAQRRARCYNRYDRQTLRHFSSESERRNKWLQENAKNECENTCARRSLPAWRKRMLEKADFSVSLRCQCQLFPALKTAHLAIDDQQHVVDANFRNFAFYRAD